MSAASWRTMRLGGILIDGRSSSGLQAGRAEIHHIYRIEPQRISSDSLLSMDSNLNLSLSSGRQNLRPVSLLCVSESAQGRIG